ncbi:MAG: hypothetical protein J0G98_01805 [Terrimonas ferruginea]|jgi:CHASE3 domain sensor protein|uniref:hypothetical protein n=1 Tax=Terrimonas ferruginea TaxID=249 RepID=UPI000AE75AF5|nr:hypothetical protein [Terrimonas ferruginea]MBN8781770.1 hypothetical protein [Terrimonas ferruginea]
MKNRAFPAMGAFHPLFFFVTVYVVALFLSIFICSSIFYSLQDENGEAQTSSHSTPSMTIKKDLPLQVSTAAVALR